MALLSAPPFFRMDATEDRKQLSSEFYLYNDQMFQYINTRLSPYGVNYPAFTDDEVADFPPGVAVGTMWYNSTQKKMQFKADTGIIETITST
jgi:hypothetical protein